MFEQLFSANNQFLSGGLVLMVVGGLLAYFRNIPSMISRLLERYLITRIEIDQEDESFAWLKIWFAQKLSDSLSVSVFTRRKKMPFEEEDEDEIIKYERMDKEEKSNKPKIYFAPAPGIYWFFFKGKFCILTANKTDPDNKSQNPKPRESYIIRLLTRNRDIGKTMVEEARDLALPDDNKINIRAANHNYWSLSRRVPPRDIESVILDNNQGKVLLDDINNFLKRANWYHDLGIPYRRGYLLEGQPGGGKTSLALALASSLKMDVYALNLSTQGLNDINLEHLFRSVSLNSIILIEDVDCAFKKRKSQTLEGKSHHSLTFSGLLNAIDGINAQDGRIVFMTTNYVDRLDEALIRDGRIDVRVNIGLATKNQMSRMFARFFPEASPDLAEEFAVGLPTNYLSMAALQGHLIKYRDPRMAIDKSFELVEYVKDKENRKAEQLKLREAKKTKIKVPQ